MRLTVITVGAVPDEDGGSGDENGGEDGGGDADGTDGGDTDVIADENADEDADEDAGADIGAAPDEEGAFDNGVAGDVGTAGDAPHIVQREVQSAAQGVHVRLRKRAAYH